MRFNGVPTAIPADDENLHSFSVYPSVFNLSALAQSASESSPWSLGGGARAQLATDFLDLGKDDFTFDLAIAGGYRFSDHVMIGAGGALTDINADMRLRAGIGLEWEVGENFRIQGCGSLWVASYMPDKNRRFGILANTEEEVWNIADSDGKSRSIKFNSYRIGLFSCYRLTGQLWLDMSAGVTIGNEISLTNPNGDKLLDQGEMDSGLFYQISVILKSW